MDFPTRFQTTVNSPYTSGGTTLVVASSTGLGVSGACDFYCVVLAEGANTEEAFHVTNVSGTTWTVSGAKDNTSASNHAINAVVLAGVITKEVLAAFSTGGGGGSISQGTRASRPSAATAGAGAMYQCTDGPYTFISDGTNWQAYIGSVPVIEPQSGDFTQANFTNFALSSTRGGLYVNSTPAFGVGANDTSFLVQTPPAAPYTITLGFWLETTSNNGFNSGAIVLRESSSGKFIVLSKFADQSNTQTTMLGFSKFNSPSSFNSNYTTAGPVPTMTGIPMNYLRYKDTGSVRVVYMGSSPFTFQQISASSGGGSVLNTDFITPDQIGMACGVNDSIYPVGIWFLHYQVTTP